jgi:hypothetical protein
MEALVTDRVGAVLNALKRRRPRKKAVRQALPQLIGYVGHNRTRIKYQEPWHTELAVWSGAAQGGPASISFKVGSKARACAGNSQAFWAIRGLTVEVIGFPSFSGSSVCSTERGQPPFHLMQRGLSAPIRKNGPGHLCPWHALPSLYCKARGTACIQLA